MLYNPLTGVFITMEGLLSTSLFLTGAENVCAI